MTNIANKAQKYLLNNNCSDLILNDHRTIKPEDRIYTSDIMMMFFESEQEQQTQSENDKLSISEILKLLIDCRYPIMHIHTGDHDESKLLTRIDEAIIKLKK